MEAQIHLLEQEAYCAVLRAFKAQSDALTWEKEGLITELRKELRVSDDEHRELLSRVNEDDIIRRIREWRTTGGHEPTRFGVPQRGHEMIPSPTISAARKKQKTSQGSQLLPTLSSVKAMQLPSQFATRARYFTTHNSRSSSGALVIDEPPEALLGRKVWTRWPEDNHFYEAVITQYDSSQGRHALVYDIGTETETWEWVDLNEISPEDIRWDGEDPAISYHGGHGGASRGIRKPMNRGGFIPSSGQVRGATKFPTRRENLLTHNGFAAAKVSDDIELLNTETLVKEVEKVFGVSQPDPLELEKAKMMLKEHEQALMDAIARLADASDDESDGEQQFLHGQPMER
ncbi:Protein EMSY-LIKE 1 [Linum perenne]